MKAIILAAGIGKRIRSYTDKPKCLIEIEGKALIERYLECFEEFGIKDVVIVAGYKKDLIEQKIKAISFNGDIKIIENPDYSKGSIVSLWTARQELDADILLMDSDVFFEKNVLKRLMESKHSNLLIIDTTSRNTGEEYMAAIRNEKICAMERGLDGDFDMLGEWIGFLKMNKIAANILRKITEINVQKANVNIGYEDTLRDLFNKVDFGFELVDGLKWVEIDFLEDIKKVSYGTA